jgi:hypothetical protein
MFTRDQEDRIAAGLRQCLAECQATEQPFSRVSAFIQSLVEDPDWNEREVIELQTGVIRALLYRHGRPGEDAADPRKTT